MSGWRVVAAQALDQVVLAAFAVFWFGLGIHLFQVFDSGALLGVCLFTAILGSALLGFLETRFAMGLGATLGLFLAALRFDPSDPPDAHEASAWLFEFWLGVVLAPIVVPLRWLLDKLLPNRGWEDPGQGIFRDPRARTPGGRIARLVLAFLIVASPLPLVLALGG